MNLNPKPVLARRRGRPRGRRRPPLRFSNPPPHDQLPRCVPRETWLELLSGRSQPARRSALAAELGPDFTPASPQEPQAPRRRGRPVGSTGTQMAEPRPVAPCEPRQPRPRPPISERNQAILDAYKAGKSLWDLAEAYNLRPQRIHQILRRWAPDAIRPQGHRRRRRRRVVAHGVAAPGCPGGSSPSKEARIIHAYDRFSTPHNNSRDNKGFRSPTT